VNLSTPRPEDGHHAAERTKDHKINFERGND
jgi:hypothetical protein